MEFVKMHGLGNDFIILDDTDNRQKMAERALEQRSIAVRKMSCRRSW